MYIQVNTLVALLSSSVQEGVQRGSQVFTDLLLKARSHVFSQSLTATTHRYSAKTSTHTTLSNTHSGSLAQESVGFVHKQQQAVEE